MRALAWNGENITAVKSGNDVFDKKTLAGLKGKRVGVITNHSSLDTRWQWLPERLKSDGINIEKFFSPEHGPYGVAKEGEELDSYFDEALETNIVSLYGQRREMTPDDVSDLDVIIYDMQDAGVRFYTLVSTLKSAVDACASAGRILTVLDRPDPLNGLTVRGPLLDEGLKSFVGIDTIPLQYGMTPGELAMYWSRGRDCLKVVGMKGWKRKMWYDETGLPFTAPSPNLPDMQSMMLYPGLAVLEGLNVSVGRGTTRPFRLVGAPWLDGHKLLEAVTGTAGIMARFARFMPQYGKFKGEVCDGVECCVTDRKKADPVLLGLKMLHHLSGLEGTVWTRNGNRLWAEAITGVTGIDRMVAKNEPERLIASWARDATGFRKRTEKFLIYD
ncbi:MAG: DUF1343 domain-containing protein [Methanomassiliicoccales archaeon]|nr:DUF1343 domain-containing protein [Methanomassiliicoccales archaeon]